MSVGTRPLLVIWRTNGPGVCLAALRRSLARARHVASTPPPASSGGEGSRNFHSRVPPAAAAFFDPGLVSLGQPRVSSEVRLFPGLSISLLYLGYLRIESLPRAGAIAAVTPWAGRSVSPLILPQYASRPTRSCSRRAGQVTATPLVLTRFPSQATAIASWPAFRETTWRGSVW